VKFCQFIATLYPRMLTNFGEFFLIFKKMALIFLRVLIVFTVLSFQFQQVFIANDEWPQFIQSQSTGLSGLGAMMGVLTKAATEAKTSSRVLKCNLVCLTGESR